ncbi:MAG: class I SAM-dependent methyltransferase [bacterium]|nr:class I SAM-dependent methyltransferase [bacterium]
MIDLTIFRCRFCNNKLTHTVMDLGTSPVANNLVKPEEVSLAEPFYILKVFVCEKCWLVQAPNLHAQDEIFTNEYTYFSSYSSSWLKHASEYVSMMVKRFGLSSSSQVIELASNDGYLLQYFKEKGINVLGVDPCKNVAAVAIEKGIPTITQFFGTKLASQMVNNGQTADLIVATNVIAHVPDINDFVRGMKTILKPGGVFTCEVAHLLKLMKYNQFDTVYHEHYSYYSFIALKTIFEYHGFVLFDVEELKTHGGSLRIFGKHSENREIAVSGNVEDLLNKENEMGLGTLKAYDDFQERVRKVKRDTLKFLIAEKEKGKTIVGYGAPAKGITFVNYCGIKTDFLDYTVDASPHKQDRFLPGVRIPIYAPEKIAETKPDYVMILPWNLRQEISEKMSSIREWGGKFVTAIPSVEVF